MIIIPRTGDSDMEIPVGNNKMHCLMQLSPFDDTTRISYMKMIQFFPEQILYTLKTEKKFWRRILRDGVPSVQT